MNDADGHYHWGDGCEGWHLVNRPELSVIRERMPPGTAELRHTHRRARQYFFILSGRAHFALDGAEHTRATGEGLEIPPGVPHTVTNRGPDDLGFLVVSQPHAHGDRALEGAAPEALVLEGGCHCEAVRWRVRVENPLSQKVLDCNCSVCRKKGILHLIVPEAAFTLVAGQEALETYSFNTHVAKHYFCRRCGVHSFYKPRSHPDHIDVNVRCLDAETVPFSVELFDGRRWEDNVDRIR